MDSEIWIIIDSEQPCFIAVIHQDIQRDDLEALTKQTGLVAYLALLGNQLLSHKWKVKLHGFSACLFDIGPYFIRIDAIFCHLLEAC